jgi:hypothetical protein
MDSGQAYQKLHALEVRCVEAVDRTHRELSQATDASRVKVRAYDYSQLPGDLKQIKELLASVQPALWELKSIEMQATAFQTIVRTGPRRGLDWR